MGAQVMGAMLISLSLWEREGARDAQHRGKGEGSALFANPALTFPSLRSSLPLPQGEEM